MTQASALGLGVTSPPRATTVSSRATSVKCFLALVARDLFVLRSNFVFFAVRLVMQPLMFLLVFAFVFPSVGQGVGGAAGSTVFATLLVPGTVGMATMTQGINAVGLPLISDLGFTREIEDRALAPLPLWALGAQKIVGGMVEGLLAGTIVLPLALLIPTDAPQLSINWFAVPFVLILSSITGAAFGLAIGTTIRPERVPLMFSIVVLPLVFLGAGYYPWVSLDSVPALKWAMVVNPLLYVNEALRATVAPTIPHIPLWISLLAMGVFATGLSIFGTARLSERIRGRR